MILKTTKTLIIGSLLAFGALSLQACNDQAKEIKTEKGLKTNCAAAKCKDGKCGNTKAMKCQAGKCQSGKCGDAKKEAPAMKCQAGKCGQGK